MENLKWSEEALSVKIGKYKHYKGSVHNVTGIARHSETLEELVTYSHNEDMWARPVKMFLEDVVVDGKTVKRFEYIGD